ncbi:hypothetical protein [Rhodococcus sp. NPDC058521]|uniref:hypothetical protein n=1 Tax=Rhodococcus sp. NPDC058521 TaxID=3346536 RepID=UPI00366297D3
MITPEQVRDLRENGWRDSSPAGDQIDASLRADEHRLDGSAVEFSPWARMVPRVSAAMDRALATPTVLPDLPALRRLSVERSNIGDRRPQQYGRAVVEPATTSERAAFRRMLEAATTGPVGLRTVVIHGEGAQLYSAPLPDTRATDAAADIQPDAWLPESEPFGAAALVAYPVPYGYSTARVARLALEGAMWCYWCDDWRHHEQIPFALIVGAGATAHVFPTCPRCRADLDHAAGVHPDKVLTFVTNDGWDAATGYPADRWR